MTASTSPSRHPRGRRAAGRAATDRPQLRPQPEPLRAAPRERRPHLGPVSPGDARLDVWLISWPEGTETGWHDHGDASGAFAVASGVVLEQTWALGAVQHRTLTEGDARAFGRDHVHNVVGAGPGRALTVHAYAPGLVTMGQFELGPDGPNRLATPQDASSW